MLLLAHYVYQTVHIAAVNTENVTFVNNTYGSPMDETTGNGNHTDWTNQHVASNSTGNETHSSQNGNVTNVGNYTSKWKCITCVFANPDGLYVNDINVGIMSLRKNPSHYPVLCTMVQ